MSTVRQHIIRQVSHKLGVHNYNAYARENGLPYTPEWQERVDEHKNRFGNDLIIEHVDQMYSTLFTNSVESFMMGWAQTTHESHGYVQYIDSISDRSHKMLMNAIVKKAKEVKQIYINAEESKIRMAKRAEKESKS